jgi:phosphoribosylformimino-5-aminoimidazole carboxamide ribotide isomerase
MKFRPCIDLHSGCVKQIIGSTLTAASDAQGTVATNFESDLPSSYYGGRYKEDALTGGHVIMLGEGNDSAAEEALKAYPGGMQVNKL